jgi:hypothetical protein
LEREQSKDILLEASAETGEADEVTGREMMEGFKEEDARKLLRVPKSVGKWQRGPR